MLKESLEEGVEEANERVCSMQIYLRCANDGGQMGVQEPNSFLPTTSGTSTLGSVVSDSHSEKLSSISLVSVFQNTSLRGDPIT